MSVGGKEAQNLAAEIGRSECSSSYIGGQTCVNLCKSGKLFWGPKRDLEGSFQQSAGRNKHIAFKAGAKGF